MSKKKIEAPKYKIGNVIETKKGFHLVLAIMLLSETFEYIVLEDGKRVGLPEQHIIAAYAEIADSKITKKPVKRKPKVKNAVLVEPKKKTDLDAAIEKVDELDNIG